MPVSVWASYDGEMEKLKEIELKHDGMPLYWSVDLYQFGKMQHYFVLASGEVKLSGSRQYKFCFEDGRAREIDDINIFRNDNGKCKMSIYIPVDFGDNGIEEVESYIDIFYHDHKYVEYAAELVDDAILEQYDNYNEILQTIVEEFLKIDEIETWNGYYECSISEIELDHIRKAANGTYFLNYRINCNLEYWGRALGDVNIWAHAVVEATGNNLEYKEIVFGKKEERSDSGLPLYYKEN